MSIYTISKFLNLDKPQKLKITKDDTENLLKEKTNEMNLLRESFERSKKYSEDLLAEKDERLGRISKDLELCGKNRIFQNKLV